MVQAARLAKWYGDRLEIKLQGSGCASAPRGSNPLPGALCLISNRTINSASQKQISCSKNICHNTYNKKIIRLNWKNFLYTNWFNQKWLLNNQSHIHNYNFYVSLSNKVSNFLRSLRESIIITSNFSDDNKIMIAKNF